MTPEQIQAEREAFENWYISSKSKINNKVEFFRRDIINPEKYLYDLIQQSWEGWLAASLRDGKWLKANENGPPEDGKSVLFTDGRYHYIGYYDGDWEGFVTDSNCLISDALYWQYLPVLPSQHE